MGPGKSGNDAEEDSSYNGRKAPETTPEHGLPEKTNARNLAIFNNSQRKLANESKISERAEPAPMACPENYDRSTIIMGLEYWQNAVDGELKLLFVLAGLSIFASAFFAFAVHQLRHKGESKWEEGFPKKDAFTRRISRIQRLIVSSVFLFLAVFGCMLSLLEVVTLKKDIRQNLPVITTTIEVESKFQIWGGSEYIVSDRTLYQILTSLPNAPLVKKGQYQIEYLQHSKWIIAAELVSGE